MWEEDPRWQEANYRFLVCSVVIGLVGGFIFSLWTDDWQPYRIFLEALGIILGGLCIYAACVWTIGHMVVKCWSALKKLKRKHDNT
jgi:hypothetical protein